MGKNKKSTHVCADCRTQFTPENRAEESLAVEILIWVLALALAKITFGLSLLLAGVYSFRRHFTGETVCPSCGSSNIVVLDTARGRKLSSNSQKSKSNDAPKRYTVTEFRTDLKKHISDLSKPPIKQITIDPYIFTELREEEKDGYLSLKNFSNGLKELDDHHPDFNIQMMSVTEYLSTDEFLQNSNHQSFYKIGKILDKLKDSEWCCEDQDCNPEEFPIQKSNAIQPLIDAGLLMPMEDTSEAKADYINSRYKAMELRDILRKRGIKTPRYKKELIETILAEDIVKIPPFYIMNCEKIIAFRKEMSDEYIKAAKKISAAFGIAYLKDEIMDYAMDEASDFYEDYSSNIDKGRQK